MYKLLALDLDDTLLPTAAMETPARNLAAIRRAQDAGIYVTIATGRGYKAAYPICKQLGVQGPVIHYGGAIIMDSRTDAPLHTTEVSNELVQEALETARELGIHAHIYQGDSIICEAPSEWGAWYSARLHVPCVIDKDMRTKQWRDVPKVLFITQPEAAQKLIPVMQARFAGRLKVSGSSPGFIEFNHCGANKGSALQWVAEHMGVKQGEVVAVGDNTLDAEMIEWAGLGCAVGNAQFAIKDIANLHLPNCDDMAIEYLIDRVLLKG